MTPTFSDQLMVNTSERQIVLSAEVLRLDAAAETERIVQAIRDQVLHGLRRRGVVLGLSGGIDSSVSVALAARAVGPERVLGLLMPEADSSGESLRLGQLVADHYGVPAVVEDITAALEAAGCYSRRDDAIRTAIPHYSKAYRSKVVLPSVLSGDGYRISRVLVESPEGVRTEARLSADAYRTLVAATNFKQRVRKMMEYYHADRLQYAVLGTPNRLEIDQGFFVKNGDGAADIKPLAHLFKSQVYQLAEYLQIPEEIQRRPPTTDTYSLDQSQEEFYFSLPYAQMDLCLYAKNADIPAPEAADALGLTPDQVQRVYTDIDSKRSATRYLHERPLLVEPIHELAH
jgi:NAD+ synthase